MQSSLDNEKEVLKKLKTTYEESLDEIDKKLEELLSRQDADMQHVIYQAEYQKALKKQIEGILNTMEANQFDTISEYLTTCYEDGYIGTMYSLQNQGIPLALPIDQEEVLRAVQLDSKISEGLYTRLGEDVRELKKKITSEVSRGISTGMSYSQIAKQLEAKSKIGYNNAVRIVRTEGHRIQVQSSMDACYKAREIGASIVKQWSSALDARTRISHIKVNKELRELDEKFSNGLMYPGDPSGGASEVVNCRCALNQRARWALDDSELEKLKEASRQNGLAKAKNFSEYMDMYKNLPMKINLQFFASDSKDYDTIFLPKEEYAKIISEFNTNMSDKQRKQKVVTKAIGNYYYTIENNGFNNYRVIDKEPIDEDFLDWGDE